MKHDPNQPHRDYEGRKVQKPISTTKLKEIAESEKDEAAQDAGE